MEQQLEEVVLTQALSRTYKGDMPAGRFLAELKQLTPEDKAFFARRFEQEGLFKITEGK